MWTKCAGGNLLAAFNGRDYDNLHVRSHLLMSPTEMPGRRFLPSQQLPWFCFAVVFVASAGILWFMLWPAAPVAAAPPAEPSYSRDIRPLLATYCSKCHGPAKQNGGIDFSIFTDERTVLRERKLWVKVVAQLEAADMPPAEAEQPTAEQRALLVNWAKQTVATLDAGVTRNRDPGPAPLRRLTRAEYNRTLHDLLGVEFDVAEAVGLPEEGGQGFDNLAAGLTLSPALMEKYFAAADKALDRFFAVADPKTTVFRDANAKRRAQQAYDAVFFVKPGKDSAEREAAQKIIECFVRRGFRRLPTEAETGRLLKIYDAATTKGEPFDAAVRRMLKPVLVSPHFLYRVEKEQGGAKEPYRISDHELAVRLSYFLWATMPDDELAKLADEGKLAAPEMLEKQVRRMLADPKARALTERFAVQWLQLGKLATARPSTEFFPTFTQKLRQAMYDETTTFFDKLREEDRNLVELLDADYTYLNADLAKHYGISGIEGPQLRHVALKPEEHRGGLLGMGSILALTSHTSRTSPTMRGKWILEVLFGTPPPPPPPDAGVLKEEKDKKAPKSFREQLASHATEPRCVSCHKRMDPLGFALDNYDAVGAWRDSAGGQKIDATGQLPSGVQLNGAADLKQVLLKRKPEFLRNLTEQMLIYALGRDLQYFDEPTLREITAALDKNDNRFSILVLGVVKSYPFQHRRHTDDKTD